MDAFLAILLAYLVGSVPFAFLLARRRGVDLRVAGSGNVGATNVLRTTGVQRAVVAMSLDAVKGAIAVLVAEQNCRRRCALMARYQGGAVAESVRQEMEQGCWLRY